MALAIVARLGLGYNTNPELYYMFYTYYIATYVSIYIKLIAPVMYTYRNSSVGRLLLRIDKMNATSNL